MKNPLLLLGCFFLAAFLFVSCEKETTNDLLSTTEPLSDEEYLSQIKEPVVFLFDQYEEVTGERHGFFIDRQGNLKTFNTSDNALFDKTEEWSKSNMDILSRMESSTVTTIPTRDLARFHRMIRMAASGQLSARVERQSDRNLRRYRAFRSEVRSEQIGGSNSNSGCSGGHTNYVRNETVFNNVLLKIDGSYSQENQREEAREILRWLQDLQVTAGL